MGFTLAQAWHGTCVVSSRCHDWPVAAGGGRGSFGDDAMVFAVELGPRHVYCSSPHCIAALVKLGWRLSDAAQLTALVKELTAAPDDRTHDPADHLQ